VLDAELVAFMLRYKGKRAAAVSGSTRPATRRAMIADFKAGRLDVLCNCEVLTTGFDAPTVSHVVMARPTVSQVLYEQMVGRGLRGPEFGGTAYCHIVDFEDRYRKHRPILGYEQFRHVWIPLDEAPEPTGESMGLLVQLGAGDVRRYARNDQGVAACRSRPVRHDQEVPVIVSLEGSEKGTLQFIAWHPKRKAHVHIRRYELSQKQPMLRTCLEVPEGCELVLRASTDNPGGHIEVRRYNPQLGDPT
jgi:superfamily II DNA or RNA helicase